MSTDQGEGRPDRARHLLDESIASQARIAPRRRSLTEPHGDPRLGGDATKAPHSLSQAERHLHEDASSGHSWDDPDEL
ncbi:hypothetical protein BCE75_11214 [Isoptericola sp. CG 20/1183]|jgi:hypothetical protein|uniref:Uncharacterized protein n=1 Tax=Isoptericola halotolerans TaxID=300560 RepID=A0ABX5EDE1_9MICO|nr:MULTISPECIES: hypothetical protein [Isoptericola]MCK0115595.1 hypothetical protein [Isoptericola sp. S6320L]PRZ03795.1 hypothetical protein BCE75_11214 [Isoptericola sp. CG 20/1183]PRZ04072.1 hypothetical protein BCL65_111106 [Isoptericola halotolerans]